MKIDHAILVQSVATDDLPGMACVRVLFEQYANWLADEHGISLEFQGIEEELRTLPGKYASPKGAILIAKDPAENALGCIALRPLADEICEIKRMFVCPDARGRNVGKLLIHEILSVAQAIGYSKAVLDTCKFMVAAQELYREFGFSDIPAYYDNPLPDVRYMGVDLKTLI